MVIVETSVWIDYFRDKRTPQTRWLAGNDRERVGLLDLSLCEILQGVPSQAAFIELRRELLRFPLHHTGGEHLMLASAQNYRYLRSQGITVRSTIDCIIASYCIQHGCMLLHNDRDFDGFELHLDLRVLKA